MRAICALLMAMLSVPAVCLAAPTVFWASDPVSPDEAALFIGDSLDGAVVTLRHAEGVRRNDPDHSQNEKYRQRVVEVLQGSAQSLKVIIPREFAFTVYEARIETATGSTTVLLNRPTIYWVQGDEGASATAGGWLRVFGRAISLDGACRGRLSKGRGTAPVFIDASRANLWEASFSVPAGIPNGVHAFDIQDGRGDWIRAGEIDIRVANGDKRKQVNVRDFGASGAGKADDTGAIRRAIAAAASTGSEVFFPAGRYRVSDTLVIPPGVDLVGERREEVNIFWPDMEKPPLALIQGGSDFGLRDLTLYASNYIHFISTDERASHPRNVRLARLRVRADPYRGKLKVEEVDARFRAQQKFSSGGGDVVRLRGANISITDSDFYGAGRSFALFSAEKAYVARNRFSNGRWGWYSISGPNGVIFEDNVVTGADLMSTGGGINTLDGSTSAQNVFVANNRFETFHGWDREALTSDGGYGFFYGRVAEVVGRQVRLGERFEGRGKERPHWEGAGLFILGGRGMGEFARIEKADVAAGVLTIDRDLAVLPDHESIVTIVPLQQNFILFRNTFVDTGVALQYYGTSINHVAVENESVRTGGMFSSGRWYLHYQPSWYCQFLGNRIVEGNFYRGGSNNATESGEAVIGSFGYQRRPNRAPLGLAAIHRGNEINKQGEFRFEGLDREFPGLRDVIVEVSDLPRLRDRIHADDGVAGLLLRQGIVKTRRPGSGRGAQQ